MTHSERHFDSASLAFGEEAWFSRLQAALGYRFGDAALPLTALTHPSYGADYHAPHYQRLEFLGDAVLQLIVSEHLYARYAHLPEGTLTFARAKLVREDSLGRAARRLGLGEFLRLAVGAAREGGADKDSILSDAMESVIAAIYLDGGYECAKAFALNALAEELKGDVAGNLLDAKSRLQMITQRDLKQTPVYELTNQGGEAHRPVFTVRVSIGEQVLATADGSSKQAAQQEAARRAIEALTGRSPQGLCP